MELVASQIKAFGNGFSDKNVWSRPLRPQRRAQRALASESKRGCKKLQLSPSTVHAYQRCLCHPQLRPAKVCSHARLRLCLAAACLVHHRGRASSKGVLGGATATAAAGFSVGSPETWARFRKCSQVGAFRTRPLLLISQTANQDSLSYLYVVSKARHLGNNRIAVGPSSPVTLAVVAAGPLSVCLAGCLLPEAIVGIAE